MRRTSYFALSFLFLLLPASLAIAADSSDTTGTPQLQLARGEDGKVTLAFTAVPKADCYSVRVSSEQPREDVSIDPIEVTDYTVHGLTNGRTYRFAVCAVVNGQKVLGRMRSRPLRQPIPIGTCCARPS